MSRERTAADHEDRMSSPIGSKNIVNLKAMSGSEDGLDRERSTSVQVKKDDFYSTIVKLSKLFYHTNCLRLKLFLLYL